MTQEASTHATGLDIWDWSGNNPPPSAGQFASDTRNWDSPTSLSIANSDTGGNNATTKLSGLQVGDKIRAAFVSDATRFQEWTVTGTPVSQAGWFDVPVSVGTAGGAQPQGSGQSCNLTITPVTPPDNGGGLPVEPMYGPEDVARAVHTSGKRALASAYFSATGIQWLNKADAQALVDAIDSGQPLPPPVVAEPSAAPSEEPQGGTA